MSQIECRVCANCGQRNPVNALECSKCGFDLTMIPPTFVDEQENTQPAAQGSTESASSWRLVSETTPTVSLEVDSSVVVGRESSPISGFLSGSTYISREHASLTVENGILYVTDASTNGTFINSQQIKKLEKHELHPGDIVTFADISFRVHGPSSGQ